jgi:chaperonin GroEL
MEHALKDITSGNDAKTRLLSGVNKLADVVSSTFGYRGRTVLIESPYGLPEATKDGYKTLQSIFLSDPVEAMACEISKQASQRTVDMAGDGTSSTIILLQAFFKNSLDAINSGKSAIDVKNEIEASVDLIVKYLDENSIELTDKLIYDVALTSANGEEEIAKVVADAFISAGEHGSVSHLRSANEQTYVDKIEGTLLESGYVNDLFVNNPADRTCELEEPLIVCSNIVFKTFRQVQPFLEFALANNRSLVIIGDWQDQHCWSVRDVITQNVLNGKIKCALVNVPSFGNKRRDYLTDLATLCGTQLLSTLSGDDFKGRETSFLGNCHKVTVGKSDTIIIPNKTEEIQKEVDKRIDTLNEELLASKNPLEKNYISERLSKLYGGVSIIKVGSIIESELQEKIDRVDDAVCAVRSAKEEGVVAGGGIALDYAVLDLELDAVTKIAITSPQIKILENAGKSNLDINFSSYNLKKGENQNHIGYDVKNFKLVNMIDAGIVDATKAIKHALINAVSASNTLLMTNSVITNRRMIIKNNDND